VSDVAPSLATVADTAPETAEEEERRTGFLELFFDLVFVFAITQVVTLITEDTSAAGFARSTLVLGLVWWAWSGFAWMTNAIDVERLAVRLLFLLGMLGSLFMALAVPDAFQDEGAWFAVAYFAVRILNVVLYDAGLRGDAAHRAAFRRLAPWFVLAPTVALVGGFVDGDARVALWALSLAIDVVGTLTVGRSGFRVSPAHFAERYGLFVIIALGESVVAVGLSAVELERDALFAATVAVAFAGVAALWWAYFDWPQRAAERRLRREPDATRGPLARDLYTFFHFPLVLGIIFYAVAAKKTIAHPDEPLSTAGRWALGIGVAAYLAAFALQRWRAVRIVAWERLAGGALALVAVVALQNLDAVVLLGAAVLLLVAVTAVEAARLREIRESVRSSRE
jgi:low temperature requirement protein LtrA